MPNGDAPLSVADFAAKVKAKYPEYKDIPDDVLSKKIVAKYPEYRGKVQFGLPSPATAMSKTTGISAGPGPVRQAWNQFKGGFSVGGAGSGLPQQPTTAGNLGQLARFLGEAEVNFGSGELASAGLSRVVSKATRAAEALNDVAKVANPVALDTAKLDKIASKAMGMLGHNPTNAIRDYAEYRKTGQPLTFEQARNLYSASTAKTAEEGQRVSSQMKGKGVEFTKALHEELTRAADSVGKGDTYQQAVKDYGQAKSLYRAASRAAKTAAIAAGTGLIGGAAWKYGRSLMP